ncbi:kinase-regulated stress-responsive transcription factor skn7 [Mucor velutinosus]|uniref:Kinase-regulated stress-responsive transcription factor skn7 n=1 Tax=Mucor velutinosus TaxID=708070 RepID=A0AAN7HWZ9_9FUNG|nr:kinase-regulated stress-responsive transcription factor skn7 [Mucor velutinosus]
MTEITQHSLQNQVISEEPVSTTSERDVDSIPEEGDITEAAANIIHVNSTPLPPQNTHKRLHQNGGSDSEEDMTEENVQHYDVGNLVTHMDNLSTDTSEHARTPVAEIEASTPYDREQHTENGQEEIHSNIPTIEREHADPERESSDSHSIAPTDTVNSGSRPAATTATSSSSNNNITVPNTNSTPYSPRGRSVSSVSPSTLNGNLLPRSQRVWEMDRQAPECRRCHRRFNFLVRRHHCRRCGQIVCDKCSSNRIRLPVEELIEDPMVSPSQYPLLASQSQRVCDTCYREPIRRSSESHQRRGHRSSNSRPMAFGSQMRRTDSSQSLMIDCPVCGSTFLGMQKGEQEEHLQRCLNVGSPPVQSPRYIVYQLSQESTQIDDECPICFEEFEAGDKISRMICLCSYHQKCLASWLQKGKGCPVHYDSLQI